MPGCIFSKIFAAWMRRNGTHSLRSMLMLAALYALSRCVPHQSYTSLSIKEFTSENISENISENTHLSQ